MPTCTLAALCALAAALNLHATRIEERYRIDPQIYIRRALALDAVVAQTPASVPYRSDLEREAALEESLGTLLLAAASTEPAQSPGAREMLVKTRSGYDASALFVPGAPAPNGKYGLIVTLHGRGETEDDIVAREQFQVLAERDHLIVYAPYAQGSDAWGADAQAEILDQMDGLERRFAIDSGHRYLAGISMGAAGAFHLAAAHSERFAALLSIIGYMRTEDARALALRLRDKPVYLVYAQGDPIMGPHANGDTLSALQAIGVPVGLYPSPAREHSVYAVHDEIERAWSDMAAGIVRS